MFYISFNVNKLSFLSFTYDFSVVLGCVQMSRVLRLLKYSSEDAENAPQVRKRLQLMQYYYCLGFAPF